MERERERKKRTKNIKYPFNVNIWCCTYVQHLIFQLRTNYLWLCTSHARQKNRSPWIKGDKMLDGPGKHNEIDSSFNGLVILVFISHQMDQPILGFFTRSSYFKWENFPLYALDVHLFGQLYGTLNSKWSNITTSTFWCEVMK